jgi:uncharacterized protein YhaN
MEKNRRDFEMKIKQIHIDGFGKWQNRDFNLASSTTIFLGNNEAGKSTLAKFIESILFGFANGHQPYEQYLPKNGGQYGGFLVVEHHNRRYVLRRTQGKNGGLLTITDESGKRMPNHFLKMMLGEVDQGLFHAIYRIDTQELSQIFALSKNDFQNQLQHFGAVNSDRWLEKLTDLDKEADGLYKVRGRNPVINQKLEQYHDLNEQIDQQSEKYTRYRHLLDDVRQSDRQIQEIQQQLPQKRNDWHDAQELLRLWPTYQRLQSIDTEKSSTLSNNDVAVIQSLRAKQDEYHRQLTDVNARLGVIDAEPSLTDQQDFYFQNLDRFTKLKDDGTTLTLHLNQYDQLVSQLQSWQQERRELLQRYPDSHLPSALSYSEENRLQRLIDDRQHGNQSRTKRQQTTSKRPLLLIILGVIGVLLLVTGSAWLMKLLGVILMGCAAAIWYQEQNSGGALHNTVQGTSDEALRHFGIEHGFNQFPQSQWLRMQGDLRRLEELNRQIQQITTQIKTIDNQTTQYQAHVQFAAEVIDVQQSPQALIKHINMFIDRQQGARDVWQRQRQQKRLLEDQAQQLSDKLNEVIQKKATLYHRYDVQDDHEFDQYYDSALRSIANEERSQVLGSQLTDKQISALKMVNSNDDLRQRVTNLANDVKHLEIRLQTLQQNQTAAQLEIKQLSENGTLTMLRQQRADLQTEILELVRDWLTHKLSYHWINRALQLASADRFPKIIQQAQKYFETLTNHRYTKIEFENDRISVIAQDRSAFQVGELSQGTAQQLYVALKLSFVTSISNQNGIQLPVLIDDGFVDFDADRRANVLQLLELLGEKQQVIYLTTDRQTLQYSNGTVVNLNQM